MITAEKFWDWQSRRYDRDHHKLEALYTKVIENTKKYLKADDVLLDYECGPGIVAVELAGSVEEVHGIDISSKMIKAARRKAAERSIGNICFTQATIFDGGLKKGSFDVVLAIGILHLLDDVPKVIHRINQLVKPGGAFISSSACMSEDIPEMELINKLAVFLRRIRLAPPLRFLKVPELEHSITNVNFQIIETENLPFDVTHDSSYVFSHFIVAKKV